MLPPPRILLALGGLWLAGGFLWAASFDPHRLRLLVETDAGGDPDDEQSMVRFLLYANEWDVEGIIANRPEARPGENRNRERTGLGIVQALVRAYGAVHPQLVRHDPRYPEPSVLATRTVPGYDATDAGVDLIVSVVDRDDPRPVWYLDWGSDRGSATNNLRRALDRVARGRGDAGYARFKSRLRVIGDDPFGDHTAKPPAWKLWVNTFQPERQGRRWYHRFSALTAPAGGFDVVRDVLKGHGPLGERYPTNTTHWLKEGDSPTFLYLVPTGLNDPGQPSWGSWAGRYGVREDAAGLPFHWANQEDVWAGSTNRDNTLRRWAVALQNDFRARLDWCVARPGAANHPPRVILNGVSGTDILQWNVRPRAEVRLDASGTEDPDGDALDFAWEPYPEAGTYKGPVRWVDEAPSRIRIQVPGDAAGCTLHFLVSVTDQGAPRLTRYRRVVLRVEDAESLAGALAPHFGPPPGVAAGSDAYRSPLLRPDGTRVASASEWPEQRLRLLEAWQQAMGPWPERLAHPRLEVLGETRRDAFRQRRVRLETAPGQTGEGWLMIPDGPGPFGAVLVVYYEPETSAGLNPAQSHRDYGLELARRGLVTLSIGTPGGNAWKPDLAGARCQPLSFHAYVAANAWQALADLPEVDARRIGVVGHSYGGKWALFAGALWERFAAVAVSDPGIVFDETRSNVNYWEPWYLGADPLRTRRPGIPGPENPRTGAYAALRAAGRDLQEIHALLAPRPFLVSGGAEDPAARWEALRHLAAINDLLGYTNRVAMTHRPQHDPDEAANAVVYAFFERFLGQGHFSAVPSPATQSAGRGRRPRRRNPAVGGRRRVGMRCIS